MKTYRIIFFLFCLCVVSCADEGVDGGYATIQASFPEQIESKVSLQENDKDTGLVLGWEQTDKLMVSGESVETFLLASIDGKKATFTGKPVKGEVFDVILSNSMDYEERSYLTQHQNGVAATDHLEYDACLKGVDTYNDVKFTEEWAQAHGGELLQSGCLLLHLQLPVDASKVTQVKIETSAPVFYSTNSDSAQKSSGLVVNISEGNIPDNKIIKAYFMTSMQESVIEAGTSIRLTVVTDVGTYCKDFVSERVSIKPGKRNVIKLNSKNWLPLVEYKSFRFMAYNVGKFRKFKDQLGHESYPEAAAIIRHYDIDVAGLNETRATVSSGVVTDSQAKQLVGQLGAEWTYYFAKADSDAYGNSIVASPGLNRVAAHTVLLPCTANLSNPNGNYEVRSLGVVEYDDFVFCVTHLDHNHRANRREQIGVINDWISNNYGDSEKPIILVGDMNAIPSAPEITGDLCTFWDIVSVTKEGNDYVVTYPGGSKCIDYIFIWKNDGFKYSVNATEVCNTCPGVDVDLVSDHYPVYADITFTKEYKNF